MNNNARIFIIGALSVGAAYFLYMAYKKRQESGETAKTDKVIPPEMPPKEPPFACPEGEVLCPNKENVCYNPTANYIVSPCM